MAVGVWHLDFLDLFDLERNHRETIDSRLLKADGRHPNKTIFQEICFLSRLTSEMVQKYQKFLTKRIKDIEKVIESHFALIQDELILLKKEGFDNEVKRRQKEGLFISFKQ